MGKGTLIISECREGQTPYKGGLGPLNLKHTHPLVSSSEPEGILTLTSEIPIRYYYSVLS
jgi:hypothetical protein